jgi:hypothetical protein
MEALGTATLTHEIPAHRSVTTIVSREAITEALHESAPELYLDLEQGDERSTISISWTHDELEQLLNRASGDDILFTFDRDQLQLAFDDVEAHGFRERALVFTVAVAGALGSSAAIANAAPIIEHGSDGAASIATVQSLATSSAAGITSNVHTPGLQTGDETSAAPSASVRAAAPSADSGVVSNVHTPGLQTGDETSAAPSASVRAAAPSAGSGVVSNVHTPGLQTGDEGSMAAAASVKLSTEPQPAVSDAAMSNVHTPGLQTGDEGSMGAAASVKLSTEPQPAVSDAAVSNVHTPGLQIGPGETGASTPSISVKATGNGSDSEFLGISTQDATDALIAGGVLLAIAGATFAGTRRPGSARPA